MQAGDPEALAKLLNTPGLMQSMMRGVEQIGVGVEPPKLVRVRASPAIAAWVLVVLLSHVWFVCHASRSHIIGARVVATCSDL